MSRTHRTRPHRRWRTSTSAASTAPGPSLEPVLTKAAARRRAAREVAARAAAHRRVGADHRVGQRRVRGQPAALHWARRAEPGTYSKPYGIWSETEMDEKFSGLTTATSTAHVTGSRRRRRGRRARRGRSHRRPARIRQPGVLVVTPGVHQAEQLFQVWTPPLVATPACWPGSSAACARTPCTPSGRRATRRTRPARTPARSRCICGLGDDQVPAVGRRTWYCVALGVGERRGRDGVDGALGVRASAFAQNELSAVMRRSTVTLTDSPGASSIPAP